MTPHDGGNAALSFPHAAPPAPGTVATVAPGIKWLRMPLPFALDHINLWLLEEHDGWVIVDSGLNTEETKRHWEDILARSLGGKPVTRLIVTHFHPDHMGLAGWLSEKLMVPLWCTETEWLFARMLCLDETRDFIANSLDFYRRTGADEITRSIFAGRGNTYRKRVSPVPHRFHRLSDGADTEIGGRDWSVIVGRGHAPEHACLYCRAPDVLIAGDQVLPKISPNVSVWPQEPDADPLALFLASLEKIKRAVPASAFVLPSHGLPFHGLHTRIDQLTRHHEARLSELEVACAEPRTCAEIVPVLFRRKLDAHQLGFAIGETLAHLHYLVNQGRMIRTERDDGVYIYRRAIS
ncbi:MAG TPA: MBL fold metallo-hydrolase [Stellaceae bacterium]|nr:MBL fold metallo-hydrolase [Stellaceae bacterium]